MAEAHHIRKRGAVKAKLTILAKYIDSVQQKIDNNESITELEYIKLQDRISHAQQLMTQFDEVHSKIEIATEDIEQQSQIREEFEQNFFDQIARAKLILSKCASNSTAKQDSTAKQEPQTNIFKQSINLPKISLPKFNGTIGNWLEFRDTFESLIHNNGQIDAIDKFHYLKASLSGEASEIIKSIDLSSTNYAIAWDIICNRYNNNQLLVHNHVKGLFNIEPLLKESAIKIRNLIDNVSKNLRSLETLKQPVAQWDTLIIYLIQTKLDYATLKEWEILKAGNELPALTQLLNFLKNRADVLEMIEQQRNTKPKPQYVKSFLNVKYECPVCNGDHYIQNCEQFKKLPIQKRIEQVKKAKLCLNCLRPGHQEQMCKAGNCRKCSKRHNTNLHLEAKENNETSDPVKTFSCQTAHNTQILLATAVVKMFDQKGTMHKVRAILDSGSQASFISEKLCKNLQLNPIETTQTISGINKSLSQVLGKCNLQIQSIYNNFKINLTCLIIPEITGYVPNTFINKDQLPIPPKLKLADPMFHKPSEVDMLIGADCFWQLICPQQKGLGLNRPVMQQTKLGWIIAGPMTAIKNNEQVYCNLTVNLDIQNQLHRFWELEEYATDSSKATDEEIACEMHFQNNVKRTNDGRFIVSIPFKESTEKLGNSMDQAKRRLYNLETKLRKNQMLHEDYKNFMTEYENLGHMSKVDVASDTAENNYYMPHHCVIRSESVTTKLRVVFDASAKSASGYSLNDLQMTGPTIQNDLISILLRWRKHTYAIVADISKMYRQILMTPKERDLQRILWRTDPGEPLSIYKLNTVTYGTTSAPFLAIRCLKQLADEIQQEKPEVARTIRDDFYVDDMVSGANSITEAIHLRKEVSDTLKAGGFELRKFCSNNQQILNDIENKESSSNLINLGENENTKTLGLYWCPNSDNFLYKINNQGNKNATKRSMLSSIAQIYDPLGFISPCIISAKVMMQALWLEKLDWDEEVSIELKTKWNQFIRELDELNKLRIPRHVLFPTILEVEMHGFSDASENAYGGCIYLKSTNNNSETYVQLLMAKSKVAPLKSISIPRLELCAALLTARLARKAKQALNINLKETVFWTDSTIVLDWLKLPPRSLKSFVGNRTTEILDLTTNDTWRHVPTKENPADILSRGIQPKDLIQNNLWWHGPNWLLETQDQWPTRVGATNDVPEMRNKIHSLININNDDFKIENYSNLRKLKRIIAYVIRFKNNCLTKSKNPEPLNATELRNALYILIQISQRHSFNEEINNLSEQRPINNKSKIINLNPYLDEKQLLRVGGRLQNSEFDFEKKHPIIICSKNHLTKLIFEEKHDEYHHAGPQHLLSIIREEFWPIGGKNLAKYTVRKCIRCFRMNPKVIQPIMGNLPKDRLQPGPPFNTSGVDYAGPFQIKDRKGRGCKITKGYICLFVCFISKAVHLELVSTLSKDSFLMALRRFVARRGRPSKIWSDNGTNFVAAHKELNELANFLKLEGQNLEVSIAEENVNWTFIPPYSPHFGGLWEAGVKAVKHHLKRILGNLILTTEEFYTVLVQVEAIVNSRPLSPLSSDPNDLLPLTPAHFLVGRSFNSMPDEDYTNTPVNRLAFYQFLQSLVQHMWKRWSLEYISELQQRVKWKKTQENLKEGCLVVIKEENSPPLRWKLGRVIQLHKGRDGIGRVVSIQIQGGIIRRAIGKICPLPIE